MTTALRKTVDSLSAAVSKDDICELTVAYAAIDAISGHEQALVKRLVDDLRPLVDEVFVDAFGNIVGTRYGVDRETSLMISAHSDEIGLLMKSVEPTGMVRVVPIGGVSEALLVG